MIKAVLFDYGGVLTPGGTKGCVPRFLGAASGLPSDTFFTDTDLFTQIVSGSIDQEHMLAELRRRHPAATSLTKESYHAQLDIFTRSEPVYQLAEALRGKGIATGILSNMDAEVADELIAKGMVDGFSPILFSGKEKLMKPDRAYFERAIDKLGVPANEVVFIDDQERFRAPTETLGMYFVLAVSPQQIVAAVEQLLKEQNGI